MTYTTIVTSTHVLDIEIPTMVNIIVSIVSVPTKKVVTPTLPQGGVYFDGQWYHIATYSLEESEDYFDKALALLYIELRSLLI